MKKVWHSHQIDYVFLIISTGQNSLSGAASPEDASSRWYHNSGALLSLADQHIPSLPFSVPCMKSLAGWRPLLSIFHWFLHSHSNIDCNNGHNLTYILSQIQCFYNGLALVTEVMIRAAENRLTYWKSTCSADYSRSANTESNNISGAINLYNAVPQRFLCRIHVFQNTNRFILPWDDPSIPYFIEPIQHHHSFVGLISSVDKCFCNTSVITMVAMQINRLTRTFLRKHIHSKKAVLQILDISRISASYTVFPLLLFITSPVGYFII